MHFLIPAVGRSAKGIRTHAKTEYHLDSTGTREPWFEKRPCSCLIMIDRLCVRTTTHRGARPGVPRASVLETAALNVRLEALGISVAHGKRKYFDSLRFMNYS